MTDSYRRRLNRIVWSYGGRVLFASPEWLDRMRSRDRRVRASVYEDNHGSRTADSYRDRLACYLPALMLALMLAGCAPGGGPELVFVCEDDGALTEQHVGVAHARYRSDQAWLITYTDGHHATYSQRQGETCYTERAATH